MTSPDRPKPVTSAKSRDEESEFTVDVLTLDVKQALKVTSGYAADGQDGATHQVASGGVKFSATVTLTGSGLDRKWRTGWIQTVLPCSQWVTYQNATGQVQGTMTSTQRSRARDGDTSPDGETLCIWYDTGTGSALVSPGGTVIVAMDDQPNVPFHPAYAGKNVPGIKGWKAVGTAGDKNFCSWLVAEAENDKEGAKEIVYLYFFVWTCDFGAVLQDGALVSFTGSTNITSQGPGKGDLDPCFDLVSIDEDDFPYEPDDVLKTARAPFQKSAATGGLKRTVATTNRGQKPPQGKDPD